METLSTYLFSSDAPVDSLGVKVMVWAAVAVLALIALAFLASFGKTRRAIGLRATRARFASQIGLLQGSAIAGLVLLLLRYEGIYPFTMRLWIWLLGIFTVVFLVLGLRRVRRQQAVVTASPIEKEEYTRYLPKPKNK